MSDLNALYLYGRVVKDAELKKTSSGVSVAVFTIASNRTYKDGNGEFEEKGNFFPLAVFGNYAEKTVSLLKKGLRVTVEGYLKQDKWEKDGEKRSSIAIGVKKLHLLFDKKPEENAKQSSESQLADEPGETIEFADEQLAEMYPSESEVF